jgi:hypothetical protein
MRMLRNLVAQRAKPLHALGYAFAGQCRRKRINKESRLQVVFRHPSGNPLYSLPNTLFVKSFGVESERDGGHHAAVLNCE